MSIYEEVKNVQQHCIKNLLPVKCGRTACQNLAEVDERHFNIMTNLYYCHGCTNLIRSHNRELFKSSKS